MSFTVADVLLDVRELIQDTKTPYRYSDAFVIRKINRTLSRMAVIRPDLFTTVATIACVAGSLQASPADSVRLMDVLSTADGSAVKEVSQDVQDMMFPAWENLAAGPAINWMRYPRDPNRFYVSPSAVLDAPLTITYAKVPAVLTSSDTVPIQDAYLPTVIDGTVWLMESIDAESVESGRAKMFQDSFKEQLTAGLTARRITDTGAAGLPKEEIIL
jgi:hypothetical protein